MTRAGSCRMLDGRWPGGTRLCRPECSTRPLRPLKVPPVTPRFLISVFDTVYLLALTSWVGSILFFSFGVAPVIFKVLGAEAGARFVRALFPRYYMWGATSGAIALPAAMGVPLSFPEFRGPLILLQAGTILAATLIMLYAGNSLTPAINAARDGGPATNETFERLHRRSVRLNALVLVMGIGLLVAFANRPVPKTSGIIEPSPLDRARMEAERLERANAAKTAPRPAER